MRVPVKVFDAARRDVHDEIERDRRAEIGERCTNGDGERFGGVLELIVVQHERVRRHDEKLTCDEGNRMRDDTEGSARCDVEIERTQDTSLRAECFDLPFDRW